MNSKQIKCWGNNTNMPKTEQNESYGEVTKQRWPENCPTPSTSKHHVPSNRYKEGSTVDMTLLLGPEGPRVSANMQSTIRMLFPQHLLGRDGATRRQHRARVRRDDMDFSRPLPQKTLAQSSATTHLHRPQTCTTTIMLSRGHQDGIMRPPWNKKQLPRSNAGGTHLHCREAVIDQKE
jgi:hypothetical protein